MHLEHTSSAHELEPRDLEIFETAVRYQMYHALALLAVGWLASREAPGTAAAGWAFVIGIAPLLRLTLRHGGHRGALARCRHPAGWRRLHLTGWLLLARAAPAELRSPSPRIATPRSVPMGIPKRYDTLLQALDRWFARGSAEAGRRAWSHAGPVAPPAATAPLTSPPPTLPWSLTLCVRSRTTIADGVVERANAQVARYAAAVEGWGAPWDVDAVAEDAFDALCEEFAEEPCPALGEEGGCLIYESRPATCRMTGLGMLTHSGELLENVCPIQGAFPEYAAFPPTPFDLHRFESLSEQFDLVATQAGWVATTVAGVAGRAN